MVIPDWLTIVLALSHGWSDLGTDTEMMRFVFAANLTGKPAITFPMGCDSKGMPIGMQAMGRHWEENLLLRVAYNAELRMKRLLPSTYLGLKSRSATLLNINCCGDTAGHSHCYRFAGVWQEYLLGLELLASLYNQYSSASDHENQDGNSHSYPCQRVFVDRIVLGVVQGHGAREDFSRGNTGHNSKEHQPLRGRWLRKSSTKTRRR
ncbi:MAG: amidase family protein [Anaerolineaceae bacterium]